MLRRVVSLSIVCCLTLFGQLRELKPGFNLFSPDQDIQLGKEAAAQVEQQMQVIPNPELTRYLQGIVTRLSASPHAGKFPFTVKVVNDKSINAFALPGGPMFIHTGLMPAIENESQLAGVLAHEMSHVALRHGTNQASKAQLLQLPAALAGAVGGSGGLLGTLTQLGVGIGANSVLLKFSRNAERDADLNGARIMNDVGYNPLEMARFFEKLEAETGKQGAVAQFFSNHPNPGNRVMAVEEEIRYMPQHQYQDGDNNQLRSMQRIVASLPPPPPPKIAPANAPAATSNTGQPAANKPPAGPATSIMTPSTRMKSYQGRLVTLSYPENWNASDGQGTNVTIAPAEALMNGSVAYGAVIDLYSPPSGNVDLQRDTTALVNSLVQQNQGMKQAGNPRGVTANGVRGLLTPLEGQSVYANETEADMLVTLPHPNGLLYIVFVAPKSQYSRLQQTYEVMLQSIRLPR